VSVAGRSALPRLLAITDLSLLPAHELVARLQRLALLARPGTLALLLRDHSASALQRLTLGKELQGVARSAGQALWVADRLDLAVLLEADGVHLGEGSVSPAVARQLLGDGIRISRAWHAGGLVDAPGADELADVDALLVSPVLAPRKGRPALGLTPLGVLGEQLRARNWACQPYALGGVCAENAGACLRAGAHGVAAIGATLAEDPVPLLASLQLLR
jgi:thiamine-phosphate pyrophosphorylase